MSVRHVFVIWTHLLFYETVRLLLNHPDIVLASSSYGSQYVHDEILKTHPDIVLFERLGEGDKENLMKILEIDTWNLRIIGLSLEDNEISIFHRQHQKVEKAGDLLDLVLS